MLVSLGLFLMTGISNTSGWTLLIPGFIAAGAGIGMVNPPLAATAIGVVPANRSGMASGINSTFRQVGIATGIAALGAIFQHSVIKQASSSIAASGHGSRDRSGRARKPRDRARVRAACGRSLTSAPVGPRALS